MSGAAPIRLGVLGVGRIGRMHAELVARRVPGLVLATVFDVNDEAARSVAGELGVDAAPSAEELMQRDDVDAVAICTSTDTHVDLLVAAAKTGKPVFLERYVPSYLAEWEAFERAVRSGSPPPYRVRRVVPRS